MIDGIARTRAPLLALGCAVMAACQSEEHLVGRGDPDSQEQAARVCPAFQPGANMLKLTWNADPAISVEVADLVQIVGDSAQGSIQVISDLDDACRDLVAAFGGDPGAPSVPATAAQARAACNDAIGAFEGGLGELVPGTVPTVLAIAADCDESGAECLASCPHGPTCEAFCESSVPWMATCPGASVTITFEPALPPGVQVLWDGVAVAVGRVIAARSRLALVKRSLGRLAFLPAEAYELKSSCLERLVGTLRETSERNELVEKIDQSFLDALDVVE